MNDWTNAVKAAVVGLLNGTWGFGVATAVLLGWHPDVTQLAVVSGSFDVVINSAALLWLLLTYRNSPARAQDSVLVTRGLKP